MSRQVTSRNPTSTAQISRWKQIFAALRCMLSTGVFVGIGIAANVADSMLIWALSLAALVALINSWSGAQKAIAISDANFDANFDAAVDANSVRVYPAWLLFAAAWLLFLGDLISAAVAALGVAGYLLSGLHIEPLWLVPTALIVVLVLTLTVWKGQRYTRFARFALVIAGLSLLGLILAGLPRITQFNEFDGIATAASSSPVGALLQATALLIAAYTSSENWPPGHTFQAAQRTQVSLSVVLLLGWLLYVAVAIVGINAAGVSVLGDAVVAHAAPLITVMQNLALPGGVYFISLGAIAAMTGMIGLLLPQLADRLIELSRPVRSPAVQMSGNPLWFNPTSALLLVCAALGCIVLVGDVQTIWAFAAFAFLMHAALVHWMVFRQPSRLRLYPRGLSAVGAAGCLFLVFWLEWQVWLVGLGLTALGLIWRGIMQWSEEQE